MEDINYSRLLLDSLIEKMKFKMHGFNISESPRWCGFYQKGGKRFAFILKSKLKPKIEVWCWGNEYMIKQKWDSIIDFKSRSETTGNFGKDFKINFVVNNIEQINSVAELLHEVSESWSRNEMLAAYNVYCQLPKELISVSNKEIIKLSAFMDKQPIEIVKRFNNFTKYNTLFENLTENDDYNIYNEFNNNWNKLVIESEKILIDFEKNTSNENEIHLGKEKERFVKTRVNQNFFRNAVLSSYSNKCCITSIPFLELLNASHIIPWSMNEETRLNPKNGLSLNALHDRAFDRGLITVTTDYRIKISRRILDYADKDTINTYFTNYNNSKISLPDRFIPEKSFLEFHNANIFIHERI